MKASRSPCGLPSSVPSTPALDLFVDGDMDQKEEIAIVQINSNAEKGSWSIQDEGRIRRRLDLRLMPVVFLLYLATFVDRSNIGNARILGMSDDLHLGGYRFNWALTTFYIAYMLVSIPSNVGLRVAGGRFWLSGMVLSFGLVTLCTAFAQSYQGLLVLRVFLGVAEGGALPGFSFFLSLFYRRHELAFRVACFMCGASLAGAFGGLLAAGLSQIPAWGTPTLMIGHWRNIFLFEGLISMLLGLVALVLLPTRPLQVKALSITDRQIASRRIEEENREQSLEKIRLQHVIRGVFNINNNIFALGLCCANISVISLSVFIPTLLRGFGWGPVKANLMSVPPYAVAAIFTITIAIYSDRIKQRGVFIACCAATSAVGFSILVSPVSNNVKYVAVFFACCGCFALGPTYICWTLNNAAGPTIRAVSVAYMSSWSQIGTLIAVWSYLPKDGPRYLHGHSVNLGANCLNVLVAVIGILYCRWENGMRDKGVRDHRIVGLTPEQEWQLGYRHPRVRYTT